MTINVKKLDGSLEPLDLNKILRWASWAASESKDISFESVLTFAANAFYDGISTSEITEAICKSCEDLAKAAADEGNYELTEQYEHLSRNLYIPCIIKRANYFQGKHLTEDDLLNIDYRISDTNVVPLRRFKLKSIIQLGVELGTYDPLLLDGTLSDELFDFADQTLDYSNMLNHNYGGLRQIEAKYLRRSDNELLEDNIQLHMLMAIAATHSDAKTYPNGDTLEFQKESLENYYRVLASGEINAPTPFLLSLRTDFKQYDSCCLFSIDDTNLSIKSGMGVAMDATVAGAGVGVSLGRIRSKGSRFRKQGVHKGPIGYLGQLSTTVKGSSQESRGGGATVNFPLWSRDIYDLVMLKDVTGVEGENRYRRLDYCFHFSRYMVDKLRNNEKILLVSPHTLVSPGVTVYDAFYNVDGKGGYDDLAFKQFCEEKLLDPNLPHITNTNSATVSNGQPAYTLAYELFSALVTQMANTGRIYTFNVDNVNNHSAFLDAVEMTNLCVEILQPTSPVSLSYKSKENQYVPDTNSEVSFCQLAGIVVGKNVRLEDLPRICYWTLRLQEAIFNISEYSSIAFSNKQKQRRNVGIGLVNLQHLLVREVYSKYPESEWVEQVGRVTHEWYEAVQYNLILASTQIAEVLGPCDLIERSRYGHGILPIDHAVDSPLTRYELKQDWEGTLRPRLIKFKSRFGVLSALMPAESSSVVFGTINGIEFPRQAATYKGNKKLSVLVTVPEIAKYGKHYVYAWGDYSVDVNDIYLAAAANITKFLDQGISYNFYIDYNKFANNKVREAYLIDLLILKPTYNGIKTTYYINFNTDIKEVVNKEAGEEDLSDEELAQREEERQFFEQLRLAQEELGSGCESGACSI